MSPLRHMGFARTHCTRKWHASSHTYHILRSHTNAHKHSCNHARSNRHNVLCPQTHTQTCSIHKRRCCWRCRSRKVAEANHRQSHHHQKHTHTGTVYEHHVVAVAGTSNNVTDRPMCIPVVRRSFEDKLEVTSPWRGSLAPWPASARRTTDHLSGAANAWRYSKYSPTACWCVLLVSYLVRITTQFKYLISLLDNT